jgi:hypothetical protein
MKLFPMKIVEHASSVPDARGRQPAMHTFPGGVLMFFMDACFGRIM